MSTSFSIISTAILLTFVIDPFGNIPLLLSLLKDIEQRKRLKIILRETLVGLGILLIFLFFGDNFLKIFHLQTEAITLAGGVVFFIIGIKMIFPGDQSNSLFASQAEPLIVPIAFPMIAGPSTLATLLVMANNYPAEKLELFYSLLIAWFVSSILLLLSPLLYKILKEKGLHSLERLMGMLILILSIQMLINGFKGI